jgi:hypothetical protein
MVESGIEERELADRFANYSDAVVAISLVNVLGFFFAIAEQEIRCSLVDHTFGIVIAGVAIQLGYILALVVLRRGETRLRQASGIESDAMVKTFRQRLSIARFALVVGATCIFAVVAPYGLVGPAC